MIIAKESGLIEHNYSLLRIYTFKTGVQLGQGNDSCLNELVHVNVSYLLCIEIEACTLQQAGHATSHKSFQP